MDILPSKKIDTFFSNGEKNSKSNIKMFRMGKSRDRKTNGFLGMGCLGDATGLNNVSPKLQNVTLFGDRVFADVIG